MDSQSLAQLKISCSERGLPCSGKKNELISLLKNEKNTLDRIYKGLSEKMMKTGNDDNDIYIRLGYDNIITLCEGTEYENMIFFDERFQPNLKGIRALNLQTLQIPKRLRGRKIFSHIIAILEKRADKERVVFLVAPLFEQEDGPTLLPGILDRRGYKNIQPVGKYRPNDKLIS